VAKRGQKVGGRGSTCREVETRKSVFACQLHQENARTMRVEVPSSWAERWEKETSETGTGDPVVVFITDGKKDPSLPTWAFGGFFDLHIISPTRKLLLASSFVTLSGGA